MSCLIFTDRVRSTTGRLCFDTCLSIHPSVHTWVGVGGGTWPGPGGGGYPKIFFLKDPMMLWQGTPPPHQVPMGGGGGGVPWLGHQKEYLIRRGRYASCVHAGGLSCSILPLVITWASKDVLREQTFSARCLPYLSFPSLLFRSSDILSCLVLVSCGVAITEDWTTGCKYWKARYGSCEHSHSVTMAAQADGIVELNVGKKCNSWGIQTNTGYYDLQTSQNSAYWVTVASDVNQKHNVKVDAHVTCKQAKSQCRHHPSGISAAPQKRPVSLIKVWLLCLHAASYLVGKFLLVTAVRSPSLCARPSVHARTQPTMCTNKSLRDGDLAVYGSIT